jgi:FLVCR family MFS transporter 7
MTGYEMLLQLAPPPSHPHPVQPRRWIVLAVFSLSNALNAYIWIQFAPVANITALRFAVSPLATNMLSLVFMLLYVPGAAVTIYLSERLGVRRLLLLAAAANAAAGWVRYLAMLAPSPGTAYAGVLVGQCIGALAQPAFINAPARLAGDWFGDTEQGTATVLGSMANVVGNALGSALPSLIVSGPDDIEASLLYPAIASAVILVLSFLAFTSDGPPEPPSASAAARLQARAALQKGGEGQARVSAARRAFQAVRADFTALLGNRNFCGLFVGFGLGLGIFNALLTLLQQLISPCGYSDDTAGLAGGALLGAGLVGAGLAGALLDRTGAFVPLLQGGIALALAALVFLLSSLRKGEETTLVSSFAVTGFFLMPLLPLALENAAECSYPVAEDNAASLLLGLGNVVGFAAIFALGPLMAMPAAADCSTVLTPSAGLLFAITAAAAACIVFGYKRDYRRQAVTRREASSVTAVTPSEERG